MRLAFHGKEEGGGTLAGTRPYPCNVIVVSVLIVVSGDVSTCVSYCLWYAPVSTMHVMCATVAGAAQHGVLVMR